MDNIDYNHGVDVKMAVDVFTGTPDTIDPINSVGVQHEFIRGFGVIEHRHLLATDDGQLLFFERMQPTHEDVRRNATAEIAYRHGSIGHLRIKVAATLAGNSDRHLIQQKQNRGDVVGSETPKDVFLGPELSKVQA